MSSMQIQDPRKKKLQQQQGLPPPRNVPDSIGFAPQQQQGAPPPPPNPTPQQPQQPMLPPGSALAQPARPAPNTSLPPPPTGTLPGGGFGNIGFDKSRGPFSPIVAPRVPVQGGSVPPPITSIGNAIPTPPNPGYFDDAGQPVDEQWAQMMTDYDSTWGDTQQQLQYQQSLGGRRANEMNSIMGNQVGGAFAGSMAQAGLASQQQYLQAKNEHVTQGLTMRQAWLADQIARAEAGKDRALKEKLEEEAMYLNALAQKYAAGGTPSSAEQAYMNNLSGSGGGDGGNSGGEDPYAGEPNAAHVADAKKNAEDAALFFENPSFWLKNIDPGGQASSENPVEVRINGETYVWDGEYLYDTHGNRQPGGGKTTAGESGIIGVAGPV